MKTTRVPVLVVGAGAAGTMLTLELARRGVRVRTIDRLPKPSTSSRAIAIHARTLEILERLDKRLIERYLDRGIRNRGYVLHCVDAHGRRSELRPAVDFTKLESRYPYMLVSRQSETEQYLREYTGAHYGVSPDWNTVCVNVQQEADAVLATLEVGGVQEQVRCDYLVGCDGAGSTVRRALELEPPRDGAGTTLEILDAYLNDFPDDDEYVHCCSGADHSFIVVKLPGGFYRLLRIGADGGAKSGPDANAEHEFMRLLGRHFDGASLGKTVWQATWRSPAKLAPEFRQGRVFLAGDASHLCATPSGQGLNASMQDACNLGWKLAYVVKGLARPSLLHTYEVERRRVAAESMEAEAALAEICASRGGDAAERVHDAASFDTVVGQCSGIACTYRDRGEASNASEGPVPGDRAPDVDLASGRTLFGFTRHPRYTLFALPAGEKGGGKMELELKALAHRFKSIMEFHALPPTADLARRYGTSTHDRLLLVRPDGYVAFRCVATDSPRLEAHLTERFLL
jgi:2-polyprenyl-6-methoxyphenol hydroxylase-like FAD-dependent oxidoreductase